MKRAVRRAVVVLWPAFLVAAAAEFLFFAIIDPRDLTLLGRQVDASPMAIYTAGFFAFWALGAASASLTLLLLKR